MFEFIFGLFVFIFIAAIIIMLFSPRKNRRHPLKNHPIPDQLGIYIEGGLPIVQTLNKTLLSSYADNVKNRVLREHPKWADHEFDWAFFELKRYFIMNSLLKTVPMFSARVDDIWHEMLMFTRDYEKFSKDFFHETLHHTPNMDSTPIPGERAFFDWVYLSLFESTPNSRAIWGSFLQNPIKREILDDFKKLSEDDLLRKYFRNNEEWLEVKKKLINKMKNEILQSDHIKHGNKSFHVPRSASETHIYQYALGAAVFYSIYEEDQFQDHMRDVMPDEYYKAGHYGGGSSCSGFTCSSSSDHGSGGDSGGGDSGGSSCSSCGGGCSS
jgi:hypothetical protein